MTNNVASNNNNANNMNTIAILPGGRKLCLPPCRKYRGTRDTEKKKEIYHSVEKLASTNKFYTKTTKNINRIQDQVLNSCSNKTNSTINDLGKYNIYSTASITLHLFEDLLDLKRCLSRGEGRINVYLKKNVI